jgi:2-polyprenyl-3-methyl-5-hydroxy-6-metoxy-1,4-benzoquinol methylase
MRNNSPQLWDELWEKPISAEEDRFALAKEAYSIRWQRIEREIKKRYSEFDRLDVIELGAGSGTYAALMAQRGANVTILDYSEGALKRGREFFQRNGLTAQFVKDDALALSPDLLGSFDISLSFGLIEHFPGANRQRIVQSHFDVLKPGGLTFMSVPNKYCPPYQIFKFVTQHTGKWIFGEEYPASHRELLSLAKQCGSPESVVLGGSFPASFDFINPFKALAVVRSMLRLKDNFDVTRLRSEHGTILDSYLAYPIVLAAVNP